PQPVLGRLRHGWMGIGVAAFLAVGPPLDGDASTDSRVEHVAFRRDGPAPQLALAARLVEVLVFDLEDRSGNDVAVIGVQSFEASDDLVDLGPRQRPKESVAT